MSRPRRPLRGLLESPVLCVTSPPLCDAFRCSQCCVPRSPPPLSVTLSGVVSAVIPTRPPFTTPSGVPSVVHLAHPHSVTFSGVLSAVCHALAARVSDPPYLSPPLPPGVVHHTRGLLRLSATPPGLYKHWETPAHRYSHLQEELSSTPLGHFPSPSPRL